MKTFKRNTAPLKRPKTQPHTRTIRRKRDLLKWLLWYAAESPKRQYPDIMVEFATDLTCLLLRGGTDKDPYLDSWGPWEVASRRDARGTWCFRATAP